MKYLLWIIVVIAILFGLRLLNVGKAKRRAKAERASTDGTPAAETMVRCVRCGVYLPHAEAKMGPTGMTCCDPKCAQRH